MDLQVRRGDRLAIIGPNGIGKTTLLQCMSGASTPDRGEVKWTDSAEVGYFAQDHREQLRDPTKSAREWMTQFCPDKDIGFVRGQCGPDDTELAHCVSRFEPDAGARTGVRRV